MLRVLGSFPFPYKLPTQSIIFYPKERERWRTKGQKWGKQQIVTHELFFCKLFLNGLQHRTNLGLTGFNTISTDLSIWWFFILNYILLLLTLICFIIAICFQIWDLSLSYTIISPHYYNFKKYYSSNTALGHLGGSVG